MIDCLYLSQAERVIKINIYFVRIDLHFHFDFVDLYFNNLYFNISILKQFKIIINLLQSKSSCFSELSSLLE